jgi:hypothetical protein
LASARANSTPWSCASSEIDGEPDALGEARKAPGRERGLLERKRAIVEHPDALDANHLLA